MRNLKQVCFILISLLYATGSGALVIYENAEILSEFSPSLGWHVRDYRPTWQDAVQFAAMPFTLSRQSLVTGAELAVTALAPWSQEYSVHILGDAEGLPNSLPVWSALSLPTIPIQQPKQTYSFTTVTGDAVLLEANIKYWLYLTCASKCEIYWWWPTHSNSPPGAVQFIGTYPRNYLHWEILDPPGVNAAMFRITNSATTIPEPTTILLFISGLMAFLIGRARLKNF